MKSILTIILMILIGGCSINQSTEIVSPDFQSDFYQQAFLHVGKQLEESPNNKEVLSKYLFYCEKLEWPISCIAALDHWKKINGMSQELLAKYLNYYSQNRQYEQVVLLINEWEATYPIDEFRKSLIQGYVLLDERKKAIKEMRTFLANSDGPTANEFVASQYLALTDTLLAIYQMSKVWKQDPSSKMMPTYGKTLVSSGYVERGLSVLDQWQKSQPTNQPLALELATFYESNGFHGLSRSLLKPYAHQKEVAYRLASLCEKDQLLDSAIMYLDTILVESPSEILAITRKAHLLERKGWLSSSLRFYEQAYVLDSSDTVIQDRIQLIQGKIAYLQRQKFEESRLPLLQLESKKINNE